MSPVGRASVRAWSYQNCIDQRAYWSLLNIGNHVICINVSSCYVCAACWRWMGRRPTPRRHGCPSRWPPTAPPPPAPCSRAQSTGTEMFLSLLPVRPAACWAHCPEVLSILMQCQLFKVRRFVSWQITLSKQTRGPRETVVVNRQQLTVACHAELCLMSIAALVAA